MHRKRKAIAFLPILMIIVSSCATPPDSQTSPPQPQGDQQWLSELQLGQFAYQEELYAQAIQVFRRVIEENPGTPAIYEARWMLAKSYETKGELEAALKEYRLIRSGFTQTEHGTEALEKIQAIERQRSPLVLTAQSQTVSSLDYRIGVEDELDISVYGDEELAKTQTVRPDGKIAFPLIGDIQASSLTPDDLREQITQRMSKYVNNPRVTVIITKYNSKQVFVLGQVKFPGVLRLSSDINLLQGISRAGGVTEDADLQGALLVRNGQILPVNFEALLRHGDLTQNILLGANDTILIPNSSDKRVFVLGEVKQPRVFTLKQKITLVEAISMGGGLTRDAQSKNVVILRGGLGDTKVIKINFDDITDNGQMAQNMLLQPNDIVYVPKTLMAKVDRYVESIARAITPVVLAEFGIALYPTVKSVLTTGSGPSPNLIPQPQPPP